MAHVNEKDLRNKSMLEKKTLFTKKHLSKTAVTLKRFLSKAYLTSTSNYAFYDITDKANNSRSHLVKLRLQIDKQTEQ